MYSGNICWQIQLRKQKKDEREREKLLSAAVLKKLATARKDDKGNFCITEHRKFKGLLQQPTSAF